MWPPLPLSCGRKTWPATKRSARQSRHSKPRPDLNEEGKSLSLIHIFSKALEIQGVGYRAAKQGKKVTLTLGFSHPVIIEENDDIQIDVPDANNLVIRGIDKQKVGQFAAEVREKRPPEPYKGKGIRYKGEYVIHKEGKAGKGKAK